MRRIYESILDVETWPYIILNPDCLILKEFNNETKLMTSDTCHFSLFFSFLLSYLLLRSPFWVFKLTDLFFLNFFWMPMKNRDRRLAMNKWLTTFFLSFFWIFFNLFFTKRVYQILEVFFFFLKCIYECMRFLGMHIWYMFEWFFFDKIHLLMHENLFLMHILCMSEFIFFMRKCIYDCMNFF